MADKDLGDGPSLELPKLFGRKKDARRRGEAEESPPPTGSPVEPVEAAPVDPVVDPAEVTMPLPVPAPAPHAPAPEPDPTPELERGATGSTTRVASLREPAAVEVEQEPGRRRERKAPVLPTGVAAVVVGALVATLGIGLTWLGLLGCEAVRGTQSCGGPGLLVMLAIMAAMVVGGAAMLKALGVPQSGSLSFLGFGILAVVVLMFLLEHLYEPWALVAIPLISAVGYGIAHWVTTRFTEPDPDFTH